MRASHILVKCPKAREVPEVKTVVESLKRDATREAVAEFVKKSVMDAEIVTSAEFAHILPKEEPKTETKAPAKEAPKTAAKAPAKEAPKAEPKVEAKAPAKEPSKEPVKESVENNAKK